MSNQQAARMPIVSRHAICESEMRVGVRKLVDAACIMGFNPEEALIAISDAADAELADMTEGASETSGSPPIITPFRGFLH